MIYGDVLPLFTAGRVRLLDNRRMVGQFAALERTTTATRDKIDHPKHAHDDLCNAAAGALVLAADQSQDVGMVGPIIISSPRRYVGDIDAVIDAPHLDMMKRGWPVY